MGSMDNERRFGTAGEAAEFAKQVRTVGSNVFFGNYPQSDDGDAGSPIEWTVLDYDAGNDRALLISRYGLDCQRFDTEIKIAPPENQCHSDKNDRRETGTEIGSGFFFC